MPTLRINEVKGIGDEQVSELNFALEEVIGWLKIKAPNAKWSIGFLFELAFHMTFSGYNVYAIFDEIGILEGDARRPSITKCATPFTRPPLVGLWHKHHHQAQFIWKNICLELDRPGALEELIEPFSGQILGDVQNEFGHALIDGTFSKRASAKRLTGEFIVFEKLEGNRNYYLTLGSHGEYDEIASRVSDYRRMDYDKGNA